MPRTYSFSDLYFTISHPSVGQFSANGEGLGDLNVSYSADRTAHDVSADGAVLVSKIKNRAGTIGMQILQVSSINDFMKKLWRYLEAAPTEEYALTAINARSISTGDIIVAIGCAPQKPADRAYQAQAQKVTWNMLCADIDVA